MLTYASQPGVFPYTIATFLSRANIYNHCNDSPLFPKTLASRRHHLSYLGVSLLPRPSTYHHRPVAAAFLRSSASHRTVLMTRQSLAHRHTTVNDARHLFIANFNIDFWPYPSSPRSNPIFFLMPLCVCHLCLYSSFRAAPILSFQRIAYKSDPDLVVSYTIGTLS